MVIIKNQCDWSCECFDFVAKSACQIIGARQGRRIQNLSRLGTAIRADAAKCCDNIRQELCQVAVGGIQRKPG